MSPAAAHSIDAVTALQSNATVEEIERSRAVMEIDLEAIADNARLAMELGDGQPIVVLKGDAYGMGSEVVAPWLKLVGIDSFATDNAAEAVKLRGCGVEDSIMVLYGEPGRMAGEIYLDYDLTPVVYDCDQVLECARACRERDAPLDVWIGANVGFNRAGPRTQAGFCKLTEIVSRYAAHLQVVGVLAHLTASNRRSRLNEVELRAFNARAQIARACFGSEIKTSLFASHGLLRWGHCRDAGLGRPGLMLTGEHCFTPEVMRTEDRLAKLAERLRPAVSIRARIIHLLRTEERQTLGYAPGTPVASRRLLATVALGFRSGFPAGGEGTAICRQTAVSRVGMLGMDSLQIDVTDVGDVAVGDWITLCGPDGNARVTLDSVCTAPAITPYQLLSSLRIARTYMPGTMDEKENNR
jgi:alanine racemase